MKVFGDPNGFSEVESSSLCWNLFEMNFVPMAAFEGDYYVACNQAFLDLIGYTAGEFEKRVSWREITPEEHLEKDARCIEELQHKTVSTPFEKEYICKDGSRVKFIHHNCITAPKKTKGIAVLVPV